MFAGLRSRWITPRRCAYATASIAREHVRQQREPLVEIARARDQLVERPPRDAPHHVERPAVRRDAGVVDRDDRRVLEPRGDPRPRARTAARARAALSASSSLIATVRPSRVSIASTTRPMPPRPISRRAGSARRRERPASQASSASVLSSTPAPCRRSAPTTARACPSAAPWMPSDASRGPSRCRRCWIVVADVDGARALLVAGAVVARCAPSRRCRRGSRGCVASS